MDQKVKFAELVAKTGVFFGAADGNYDDKEKAFINLFIGYLKSQAGIGDDVEQILAATTNKKYELNELIEETKTALAGLGDAERKSTLNGMKNFINTIVCVDGTEAPAELEAFDQWKKALGVD